MPDPIYGFVREASIPDYGAGATSQIAINDRGELLVAQALPPKAEIARLGRTWSCTIPTGSAYTNVADMPTTRAELALYNGYATTGPTLVIDSVWFISLTSVTAAAGVTLIYQVAGAAAALTDNTAILINSPVGLTYGGLAKRALAVTTMTANKWAALASAPAGAAASIGLGVVAQVDGAIQVRPGATLGLNAVIGTATGTSLIGVAWHEVQLPIVQ